MQPTFLLTLLRSNKERSGKEGKPQNTVSLLTATGNEGGRWPGRLGWLVNPQCFAVGLAFVCGCHAAFVEGPQPHTRKLQMCGCQVDGLMTALPESCIAFASSVLARSQARCGGPSPAVCLQVRQARS